LVLSDRGPPRWSAFIIRPPVSSPIGPSPTAIRPPEIREKFASPYCPISKFDTVAVVTVRVEAMMLVTSMVGAVNVPDKVPPVNGR
jgi:hypothetical protein